MCDDLDDLLDEVEQKFCSETSQRPHPSSQCPHPPSQRPHPSSQRPHPPSQRQTTADCVKLPLQHETGGKGQASMVSELDYTLDRLISDICDDDPTVNQELLGSSRVKSHQTNHSISKRCHPVLLGGSIISLGHSDGTALRACNRLHCTSCDFQVVWFNDYVWHSRSDYLFFRNNVPDFQRLKRNLARRKGFRAYACQCSWESVEGTVDIATRPRLKWVCGKHN